jgi:hypothetical protein
MRAVTLAAMGVALTALVLVFGVAVVIIGRDGGGQWARDRADLTNRVAAVQLAQDRNDAGALSLALQALLDACQELEVRNGDASNSGRDFAEAQRICATAGVVLF